MSDWYKMNPVDWNSGTDGLTLEQEAAYLRICNAMYISNGPISSNHFVLCGLFRCNDRKAKRLLSELVEAGKLSVENGLISNRRAVEEISTRSRIETERRSAGIRGGVESGKSRAKQLENNNSTEAIASPQNEPDKIREDKNRYISSSLRSEDKPARKKAVRMPNDFEPDLEFAMGEGLSLSEAKKEVEAMRDWSASSPNGAKLDWPATWRGWIRRRAKDRPISRPAQKPQSKFADYQDEARRQIDNALGIRDNEPSNYAFDLEPTNWRSQ